MFNAIRNAMAFLTFDELPKEERPPREIWMDPREMANWWKAVERQRDARYGKGKMSDEPIEGDVSQNDTKRFLGM